MTEAITKFIRRRFTKSARPHTKRNGKTATWGFTLSEAEAQSLWAAIG